VLQRFAFQELHRDEQLALRLPDLKSCRCSDD
jgi:hypothetical protein